MKPLSYILCVMLLLPVILAACKKASPEIAPSQLPTFRKDGTLEVIGADGKTKATFDIEIADTQETLQQGLKNRESMADNQGMLFIMDGETSHPFWMQDTYLSLDIIFIDHQKTVFQIAENTKPFSEDMINPTKLNNYTFEVKAGIARKLNITEGDTVKWQKTK